MKKILLTIVLILLTSCETLILPETLTVPMSKSCIKGDCKDGYGTFESKNQKYIGYFIDSKAHGLGTLVYKDGSKYSGKFIKGKFNGNGIFTKANGETYQGQFVDGLYNGQGTYTFLDGRKNYGGWLKGELDGKVIIS